MAIPYLTAKDPRAAIERYEQALDGKTAFIMDGPGGSVMHAEMNIGGQRMMLSGEWPGMATAPEGRSPVNFMHYVDDIDAALKKATDAGMEKVSDPETMFWGDRIARVNDGHGYEWTLAQTVEEVSPEEMGKRAAEWAASMGS